MVFFLRPAIDNAGYNLAEAQLEHHGGKLFTIFIQLSIAVFTLALIWFSFVYYPRIVSQYEGVGLPTSKIISSAATYGSFPIETSEFRLVYEINSNTYYAFIEGANIASFADNKNRATLALKSALSLETVCDLNVIYVSTAKLGVPQELKNPASCR